MKSSTLSPNLHQAGRTPVVLSPIGEIRTPFLHVEGMPIQTIYAQDAEGVVDVFPEFAAGLADLEGFERLWLLYHLHGTRSTELTVYPFLDSAERGVFATRAPVRPNHLGLSAVRLVRIEGSRIHVAGVDMLNGTPLIDIKPYVPAFDSHTTARTGWYEGRCSANIAADNRFIGP